MGLGVDIADDINYYYVGCGVCGYEPFRIVSNWVSLDLCISKRCAHRVTNPKHCAPRLQIRQMSNEDPVTRRI